MMSLSFLTHDEMEILLLLLKEKDNQINTEEVVVSEKLVDCYLDYIQMIEGAHTHHRSEMRVSRQESRFEGSH